MVNKSYQYGNAPDSGRGTKLLYALNAAAASLQRSARSEAEVLRAVSEQIRKLGLRGGLSLIDEKGENLVIRAFSLPGRVNKRLERITGLSKIIDGYKFRIAKIDIYQKVIECEKTVFVPESSVVVSQILPDEAAPFARIIVKILGSSPAIFSPLVSEGQVRGVLNVAGEGLSMNDVPAMEAFANHVAIALDNARLYEAEGKRAAELEAVRQASLGLTASLELHEVLNAILDNVIKLLPGVSNGHIFLYNSENGGRLTFGAALWADGIQAQAWSNPRPNGLTYTVARSGEATVVPDMRKHSLFADAPPDWTGAIAGLPLKIGPRVVGVMNISYSSPREFEDAELRLLRLLGDQAAIAIENARLYARAATEQRHLSLLYELGREVSASLDSDEILKGAITRTSQELEGIVGQAFLYLPTENRLSMRYIYGRSENCLSEFEEKQVIRPGLGLVGWVAQNHQAVNAPNVKEDHRWLEFPGIDDDIRSAICAPILAGDSLLGVLSVLHVQEMAFSNDQLTLLQAICQEVGLALSNAAQYQAIQRRLAEKTLIQNLAQIFNQRLEVQVLLDEVVVQLAHRLGYSQVEILLVEGESLVQRAYYGVMPPWDSLLLTQGIVGRVARTGIAALVTDVSQDSDYLQCYTSTVSELVVPIFHGTVVVGVINIESQDVGQLSLQDRDFVEVLAGQISIALESAVLYERVRNHAEELEHTVAQRTAELVELNELSHEIGYALSYEELLRLLLSHLRNAVQSELVAGGLFIEGNHILAVDADRSITPIVLDKLKSDYLELLPVHERYIDKKDNANFEIFTQAGTNGNDTSIEKLTSLIHAPIMSAGDLVGLLVAGNENGNEFGREQERLLDTFANHASNAIQSMAAKLAAEQKRLESLVEHLPVGVLLLDSDYRLLVANPLGRMILSVLNEGVEDSQISHLGSKAIEDLIAEHNDNSPIDIALDGPTHRIFEAQARPVLREKHQWVVTLREVTRERENQARIHMQDRLATVGQLAAGIAHDFNNIMAAILVYADLLSQEPKLPPISRDRISIIQQQVHRAASLIRQILDFSRRSVMEQSPLALLPFMKEFEKMLRRVMPETIDLDLSYQGENYVVRADPTRLQQVFMNLAVNARDAMPNGGLLSFELDRFYLRSGEPPPISDMVPGEWVRISVKDTGVGISPENLPHMFEPFFTTKSAGEGTGLGLAQVYGIIKQHGGYIKVQSQLGKGTRFTIYIPPLPTSLEEDDIPEPQTRFDGVGVTALVVEDDRATLEALRALLDAHNYNVLTALNGVEALERIDDTQESISLVVSDVVMPEMGGVDLYRVLQERWPHIKILFVTGHPLEGENQSLLERGDVHWLQKPFSVREFSYAVNSLMGDEKVVL